MTQDSAEPQPVTDKSISSKTEVGALIQPSSTPDSPPDKQSYESMIQAIKLEESKIKLEEQRMRLNETRQNAALQQKLKLLQYGFQGLAGILILGVGVLFTTADNLIGPYLMGLGAAAAGYSMKDATDSVRSQHKSG